MDSVFELARVAHDRGVVLEKAATQAVREVLAQVRLALDLADGDPRVIGLADEIKPMEEGKLGTEQDLALLRQS